ncbi:Alpha/beta hydrolase [Gigaspora margarita]|uniref:Alpha/beta hydrolase n=1 Tax=Gigaspora margarita TaxID=4874 RepID=A0A8H3ZZ30_GIGMA|nr:Alpha/beta hydrolase [Gigaspora margarita]
MKYSYLVFLFIYGLVLIHSNIISNSLVVANPLPTQFDDYHTLIRRKSTEKPPGAPSGTDPVQINNWWNGLSSDNQQQITAQFSEYIGSTDGIPTMARDTANRAILDSTEKDLANKYNDLKNAPATMQNVIAKGFELPFLEQRLVGIHDLQTRIGKKDVNGNFVEPRAVTGKIDPNDPTRHLPGNPVPGQPYLLGFNIEGIGYFILSIGLPETADNIVTTVPGLGRGVNNVLYQDLGNNDATTSEILKRGGNINKNAQIIWDNYDVLASLVSAISSGNARAAAPALELFQRGLVAIHKGTPPHITVVGHSFGTVVVTQTTINGHKLVADDVILIGSPGVPVDHASQIANNMIPSNPGQGRTLKTQVWASRTGNDFVKYRPPVLGNDPADKSFSATIFTCDPQGDHGGYWQGIGLTNMAYIVLGNYRAVVLSK